MLIKCYISLSIYLAPYFLSVIYCLLLPLKQKSIIPNKTFINLLCGIVVYKVKNDMDVASL